MAIGYVDRGATKSPGGVSTVTTPAFTPTAGSALAVCVMWRNGGIGGPDGLSWNGNALTARTSKTGVNGGCNTYTLDNVALVPTPNYTCF